MIQRSDIRHAMLGLSKIYKEELTKELIEIWETVLDELTETEIKSAVRQYILNPKNVFFPKPGQIYGLVRIENTDEEAIFIANQIVGAISRIGPYRSEDAKTYLGEIGWAVVCLRGGWQEVCNVESNDQIGILTAQLRDATKGIIGRKKRGEELVPKITNQMQNLKSLGIGVKWN
jgi:hypothetical protein